FNFILPFRIGEIARAHYIARGVSISRSAVFATIIFERFIDLTVLIVLILSLFMFTPDIATSAPITMILAILTASLSVTGFILYSAVSQQPWLLKAIFRFSAVFNTEAKNRIRLMC